MLLAPECRCERPLVFEAGWDFRCGRMLEPELGEGVFTDGHERLLAAVFLTQDRLRAEAAELGMAYEEFKAGPLAERLSGRDGVPAPAAPSGATTVRCAPA